MRLCEHGRQAVRVHVVVHFFFFFLVVVVVINVVADVLGRLDASAPRRSVAPLVRPVGHLAVHLGERLSAAVSRRVAPSLFFHPAAGLNTARKTRDGN